MTPADGDEYETCIPQTYTSPLTAGSSGDPHVGRDAPDAAQRHRVDPRAGRSWLQGYLFLPCACRWGELCRFLETGSDARRSIVEDELLPCFDLSRNERGEEERRRPSPARKGRERATRGHHVRDGVTRLSSW